MAPATSTRAGQTEAPSVPPQGDVTGDGTLSLADAALIKNHLIEVEALTGDPLTRADANGDGRITMADVAYVNTHTSPAVLADNAIFIPDTPLPVKGDPGDEMLGDDWTVASVNLPTIVLTWKGAGDPSLSVDDVLASTAFGGFVRRVTSYQVNGSRDLPDGGGGPGRRLRERAVLVEDCPG